MSQSLFRSDSGRGRVAKVEGKEQFCGCNPKPRSYAANYEIFFTSRSSISCLFGLLLRPDSARMYGYCSLVIFLVGLGLDLVFAPGGGG